MNHGLQKKTIELLGARTETPDKGNVARAGVGEERYGGEASREPPTSSAQRNCRVTRSSIGGPAPYSGSSCFPAV